MDDYQVLTELLEDFMMGCKVASIQIQFGDFRDDEKIQFRIYSEVEPLTKARICEIAKNLISFNLDPDYAGDPGLARFSISKNNKLSIYFELLIPSSSNDRFYA